MPVIHANQIESLVTNVFEKVGASAANARLVATHLVEANVLGHDSHGVLRVPQYCSAIENGELSPMAEPTLVQEGESGAVMDGCCSFGQVAGMKAMSLALKKAGRAGIAAVTLRNCYHTGRLGAYSAMAADAGMIGIVMVNAGGGGQSVAPFGGSERRLATNPLSIAAPRSCEFPLVLDIATSTAPEGKVRDYALRGAQMPSGWIVDAIGRPSSNPQDFYGPPAGSLLPLGGNAGYKGFGLALMIDILAGALSGAGCCRDGQIAARDGMLLIALNIEQFSNKDAYYHHVDELVTYVKECPPAPGSPGVFVPGELEFLEAQKRRVNGIKIEDNTWQQIQMIATRLGVAAIAESATEPYPRPMHTRDSRVTRDGLTAPQI